MLFFILSKIAACFHLADQRRADPDGERRRPAVHAFRQDGADSGGGRRPRPRGDGRFAAVRRSDGRARKSLPAAARGCAAARWRHRARRGDGRAHHRRARPRRVERRLRAPVRSRRAGAALSADAYRLHRRHGGARRERAIRRPRPSQVLLREIGLDPDRVTYENRSRNTWENAVFTRALASTRKPGERWLLVTSAAHMPRSMGIFRRVGFPVTAFPVDYRTVGHGIRFRTNAPSTRCRCSISPRTNGSASSAYRLTDKTDALFPAP